MEMRRRIQETALDLFDREGFENVSVEEIAQAAGCSVGNIYHYFKSKDELAIQLTQQLEQAYLADTDRSGREKLLDFVGRSLEISVGDGVLYKAFIHGLRYPEQGVLKGSEKRVYYRLLGELVDLCRREGSIRQELTTAEVVEELVTLHRGMLFEWRIYEGGFPLAQRGRRMAEHLLEGMRG
jgi:AcrR family transcriptional regulator